MWYHCGLLIIFFFLSVLGRPSFTDTPDYDFKGNDGLFFQGSGKHHQNLLHYSFAITKSERVVSLDGIEEVDRVECSDSETIAIYSLNRNLFDEWEKGTILEGGKEWGCFDKAIHFTIQEILHIEYEDLYTKLTARVTPATLTDSIKDGHISIEFHNQRSAPIIDYQNSIKQHRAKPYFNYKHNSIQNLIKRDVHQTTTIQITSPSKTSYYKAGNSITVNYLLSSTTTTGTATICLQNQLDATVQTCTTTAAASLHFDGKTNNQVSLTISNTASTSSMYYVEVSYSGTQVNTTNFKIGVTPHLIVTAPLSTDIYGANSNIQATWDMAPDFDSTLVFDAALYYWSSNTSVYTRVLDNSVNSINNQTTFGPIGSSWVSSQYYFVLLQYTCGAETCFEQSPFFTVALTPAINDVDIVNPQLGSIIASNPQVSWTLATASTTVNIQLMQDAYPAPMVVDQALNVASASTGVNSHSFSGSYASGEYYFRIQYGCTSTQDFCYSRESPQFTLGTAPVTWNQSPTGTLTINQNFNVQWTIAGSPTTVAIEVREERPTIRSDIVERNSAVLSVNTYSTQIYFGSPFPLYLEVKWNCLLWSDSTGYYCRSGISPLFSVPLVASSAWNYAAPGYSSRTFPLLDRGSWCDLGTYSNEEYCTMTSRTDLATQQSYYVDNADVALLNFTINQGVVTDATIKMNGTAQFDITYDLISTIPPFAFQFAYMIDASPVNTFITDFTIAGVPITLQLNAATNTSFNISHSGIGSALYGMQGSFSWSLNAHLVSGNAPVVSTSFNYISKNPIDFDYSQFTSSNPVSIFVNASLLPWTELSLSNVIDVVISPETYVVLNAQYGNYAASASSTLTPAIFMDGGCNQTHSYEYTTTGGTLWSAFITSPIANAFQSQSTTPIALESGCIASLLPPPPPSFPPEPASNPTPTVTPTTPTAPTGTPTSTPITPIFIPPVTTPSDASKLFAQTILVLIFSIFLFLVS